MFLRVVYKKFWLKMNFCSERLVSIRSIPSVSCISDSVPSYTSKRLLRSPCGHRKTSECAVTVERTTTIFGTPVKAECIDIYSSKAASNTSSPSSARVSFTLSRRSHRTIKGFSCCRVGRGQLAGTASSDPRSCSPPSERRPSCPGPRRASPPRRSRLQETNPCLPCGCPCRLLRA